ncbi:MAG: hypothetical protein ACOX1F_05330 [Erysipelotrichaceae bacterium]|jgi:hypothetical protein
MDFDDLKKELQEILIFYSDGIKNVDEKDNAFFDEFYGERDCDGYFKLLELTERCYNSCQRFIYDNIPDGYWQNDKNEESDSVPEDCYGYLQKHCEDCQDCGNNENPDEFDKDQ